MPFQQILRIVWGRRKPALWVLFGTVVLVTLVSLTLPKQYMATSSLVFDFRTDPIAGAVMPGMASPSYLSTQTDIMQSDRVASRAVKILRMDKNAEAIEKWKSATDGRVPLDIYYGQILQRHLAIKPGHGSNVVNLSYTGSDPHFAAAAANAFAQAFVDVNVELRVEPARQYATWFDERLKVLRADLARAQTRLSDYQRAKNIVATDERVDNETARLNSLNTQLAEIEGQKAVSSSREKNSGSEFSPDVMEDPIVQGIKTETAKAEAQLQQISSTLGNNHPQYRQVAAQIVGLRRQLDEEMKRISGSAATATRITAQQETELRAAIEAQTRRVLDLRAERDTIAILARDVDSAQRAYDAVAQRISTTNLESQMQQNNVSILSPAIEPEVPSKPKVALNILAAIVIGTLLAAGTALGLEKLDRLVRSPEDMASLQHVPLLGVLQPKPRHYSLREYVALFKKWLTQRRRAHVQHAAATGGVRS